MRRWVLGWTLALAGLLAAKPPAADVGVPGRTTPRLCRVNWQGSLGLVRVDRDTLRPLAGRRIPLAREPLAWAAPDRSRLVLGSTARGARLRLIDLQHALAWRRVVTRRGSGVARPGQDRGACSPSSSLRAVAALATRSSPGSTPGAAAWSGGKRSGVAASRRALPRRPAASCSARAAARWAHRGSFRWALAGASARQRCPRSAPEPSRVVATESWDPGLAVDRSSGRAFVVQAQAPVAGSISRRSGSLRTRSGWGRARRTRWWVQRATRSGWAAGCWRSPVRTSPSTGDPEGDGRSGGAGRPDAGRHAALACAHDRPAHDRRCARLRTLLASSFLFDSLSQTTLGSGLTGYSVDGERKFHVHGEAPITGVQPLGTKALVGRLNRVTLIDARSGRELRRWRSTMSCSPAMPRSTEPARMTAGEPQLPSRTTARNGPRWVDRAAGLSCGMTSGVPHPHELSTPPTARRDCRLRDFRQRRQDSRRLLLVHCGSEPSSGNCASVRPKATVADQLLPAISSMNRTDSSTDARARMAAATRPASRR